MSSLFLKFELLIHHHFTSLRKLLTELFILELVQCPQIYFIYLSVGGAGVVVGVGVGIGIGDGVCIGGG